MLLKELLLYGVVCRTLIVKACLAHYVALLEVRHRNIPLCVPGVYACHTRRDDIGVRMVGVYVDKSSHHISLSETKLINYCRKPK